MQKRIGILLASALIVVAGTVVFVNRGCSQHPAETARVQDTSAPAPSAQPDAPPAETGNAPPVTQSASTEGAGEETTDEAPADANQANVLLAQAMTPKQTFSDARWKQGKNYALIKPAQPTAVGPDKIEVLEMFWYGCPHCFALEPSLQSWEKTKPSYIQFIRIPATWGLAHQLHARLYYTLLALNRADLHMAAFTESQGGNYLLGEDVAQTERVQTDFARRHGIDPAAFKKAYHSEEVTRNIQKADEILRRYKVDAVPQIVINGKYWADVASAGGHSQLISLIDDLAAREHNARQ